MARKIPPFAAIRVFEAAARHCSFKKAAEELLLTQSSISHQIKTLEEFLGTQLFLRQHNQLSLTQLGETYLNRLTPILDELEAATLEVLPNAEDIHITIGLEPSLALQWLFPKIPEFRKHQPDIVIKVLTDLDLMGFRSNELDLSVQYMEISESPKPDEKNLDYILLFEEMIFPVCSPDFKKRHLGDAEPADFHKVPVVHTDVWNHWHTQSEWELWCQWNNIPYQQPEQFLDVDKTSLAIKLAEQGMAMSMGQVAMYDDLLVDGRLIKPFDRVTRTGYGYFLTYPKLRKSAPTIKAVIDWMIGLGRSIQAP